MCSDWCSTRSRCSKRYNQIESFDECTFDAPESSYICDECLNVREYRGSHVVTFTDADVIAQITFTDAERVNS